MAQRALSLSYMVFGIVALSACSDSVLFEDKTKMGVPPPGPIAGPNGGTVPGGPTNGPTDFGPNAGDGNYGSGGYGNGGGYSGGNFVNGGNYNNGRGGKNNGDFGGIVAPVGGGTFSRNMTLELDPNADLSEEDVFDVLFKGQTVDPYKVQRLGGRIQLKAMVRQERVEAAGRDSDGRAFVRMRLYFVMTLDKESTLTRDFTNGTEVVLSRVRGDKGRWQDRMEGRLKAADGRGDELEIRATRDAVSNRDLELSRPWSGEISVVRNGKSLRLGRFNGILQELKE